MSNCWKCGAELKKEGKFCPECGSPVSTLITTSKKKIEGPNQNREDSAFRFVIDTEITSAFLDEIIKFIHQQYILPHQERFKNVKRTSNLLSFTVLEPKEKWYVDVEIEAEKPIRVKMVPSNEKVPQRILEQLKEDMFIGVQLFEEQVRKTTLYFAWVEGEPVIPENTPERRRNIIYRLFSDSMLLFFLIFIGASILLFMFFGEYAPIILVAFQFVMILFSDRIIAKMGTWRITEENTNIHIFQYHLSIEEYNDIRKRFSKNKLMKMKAEIYEKTLAVAKPIDCETVDEILSRYGLKCMPENMSTKIVNVYDIVKRAAESFRAPIPRIVIANNILPNAAASGPSPRHGIILLTSGLLVQLEDDEIFNVVGHEFSHLKGRDPLILFGLSAAEFLLRFYVFWPLLMYFGVFYLFFALSTIFFIAKFFEGRADLEAAAKIGQPKVLAEALRKIGFRKLQFERIPSYKIQGWMGWDPHPPIYFRVERLESLEEPEKMKYPFIQSVKDNIKGFLKALS